MLVEIWLAKFGSPNLRERRRCDQAQYFAAAPPRVFSRDALAERSAARTTSAARSAPQTP
jgi:hypothetical protein